MWIHREYFMIRSLGCIPCISFARCDIQIERWRPSWHILTRTFQQVVLGAQSGHRTCHQVPIERRVQAPNDGAFDKKPSKHRPWDLEKLLCRPRFATFSRKTIGRQNVSRREEGNNRGPRRPGWGGSGLTVFDFPESRAPGLSNP